LPGGNFNSIAFDVSGDGRIVVGRSLTGGSNEAFRWTSETGMVGLSHLSGGLTSEARGISADGLVVVGYSDDDTLPGENGQAFRWSAETGMVGLGRLVPNTTSGASAASADGSVIVGTNGLLSGTPTRPHTEAFRWSQETGMVGLGDLPGAAIYSIAHDVSADGSVIVGVGEALREGISPSRRAFYWTAGTGMLDLQDTLVALGTPNLDGWTLREALGVSADGLTIVGWGLHNGAEEAWVATIPEPSTIALAAFAVAGLAWLVRAKRGSRVHRRAPLRA
jgi:probable HAF family extracellular repeat protein